MLGGRLSPLGGIGPAELGLDLLDARLAGGEVREVILTVRPSKAARRRTSSPSPPIGTG